MNIEDFKKKKLPDAPGVYYFLGKGGKILYIGRATSIKERVRSYFSKDLVYNRGPQISKMVTDATGIKFIETDSVLEAVILEAREIKKYQPPANTDEKDDKSFNYVVITKEAYPRVLLVRGRELPEKFPPKTRKYVIGPFPQGGVLKEAMKLVRKIFPYRDTCIPAEEIEKMGKTPRSCFNAGLGLCPSTCSGAMGRKEYGKQIKDLILFFEGKKRYLLTSLNKEMKTLAKQKRFEEAGQAKKRLFALSHIQDIALIKDTPRRNSDKGNFRIEAYDIAHMAGSEMVGVMTVVEDGKVEKGEYRKFKIRTVPGANDPAALREVLVRRFSHEEWPMPQLIVVDGNIIQRNAAERILAARGMSIPVVSVVKNDKHKPERLEGEKGFINLYKKSIVLANSEAHRFAIRYHRQSKRNNFLPT
ncbi:MAG: hypothetical protein AAB597_03310 [Patescibacteria group bacterium]